MSNLARTAPRAASASRPAEHALLDELRALRHGAPALAGLAPDTYARDHAAFELLSDQRALIAEHLAARLARFGDAPVSVLSVGCGDGSLDSRLAAGLLASAPDRTVRYVGIDPWVGSTTEFAAAMAGLGSPRLSSEVHVAGFADAPVSERFDVVIFVHSIYYVADVAATLETAHGLLRPGGELLVLNAPRAALNELVDVLAPPLEGHRQWFSSDVAAALDQAGLSAVEVGSLEALVDLAGASDEVIDFAVQARLTPALRPLVRAYLDAVSVPVPGGGARVPHPVDVFRLPHPATATAGPAAVAGPAGRQ